MLAEQDRQLIAKIAQTAETLLKETTRLRGDVVRLHGRIEPFDRDVLVKVVDETTGTPNTLIGAFEMLAQCRKSIWDCERDLSAIRGYMDGIASDAVSRDEMKPWIKR